MESKKLRRNAIIAADVNHDMHMFFFCNAPDTAWGVCFPQIPMEALEKVLYQTNDTNRLDLLVDHFQAPRPIGASNARNIAAFFECKK